MTKGLFGISRRKFLKTSGAAGLIFSGLGGMRMPADQATPSQVRKRRYDVVVVGGGPGGVPAAVAAARNGAKVLLVERYGFLGGMATAGLVYPFMKYRAGQKVIVRGLFEEFTKMLADAGALKPDGQHFDAEPMKWLLDRFVRDSGVDLLLHTMAIGVIRGNGQIHAVRVFHKGGLEDLRAKVYVDSSGDGDLAAWAGAKVEIGRDPDHACQPMTLNFKMADVDTERMPPGKEINRLYDEAKARGEVRNPRENVLKFVGMHAGVVHFNTTRVIGKTSLDGWSMTEAELEGRKQVAEMVAWLKRGVPGFENAYLMKMGPQIGVRESRRVISKYVLTKDDVLAARHFPDGIAASSYPIDIHNPTGTGTQLIYLKEGTYYTIPYRCLVPEGLDNLIVASRCISATHEAHSSLRVMPVVWAIGQAGGTAAALCVRNELQPQQVDAQELRRILKQQGAFVAAAEEG